MTVKQLKKLIRWEKSKTLIIIDKDGEKYDPTTVSFSLSNDNTSYIVLHIDSDKKSS